MIDFRNVDKYFGGEALLRDVTVRINRQERIGMVGPNGAGKSTLLGMITGEVPYDKGSINLPKNLRIGYMKQQLPDAAEGLTLLDFTADAISSLHTIEAELKEIEHELHDGVADAGHREELLARAGELQSQLEHLGGYRLRSEAEAALSNLGFPIEKLSAPLKSFSGGWQMRAMLARVLISDPDILLLDEPSNYLDIPAVEWLCKFLKSYQGTLVLISHDRFLLRKLCDVTLEVNAGTVTRYAGNYDYYRNAREARYAALVAAKRNLDRKKEHLERVIDRFRAKATKAAQAKSQQKALDRLEDIELPDDLSYNGSIRFPEPPPAGAEAARFENVRFTYPHAATPVLHDISLDIACGDKLAFVGYNGTGKTTLLKLLVGKLKPDSGRVILGHNIVLGYQAQEFGDIFAPDESAFDAVRACLPPGEKANNLMNVMGAFGFGGDSAEKPCKVLSGGEKIRLCFARIFVNPPNLLVLDEPTTHLDIAARELLQKAIQEYKGTVCIVSHDIEFVRNCATGIVAMENHSIRKYFGNYDYYLEKSAAEKAPSKEEPGSRRETGSDSKERRRERAAARAAVAAKKKGVEKRLADVEAALDKLRARQTELIELLADREAKINFQLTNRELFDVQQEIEKKTAAWEEAALRLEEIENEFSGNDQ